MKPAIALLVFCLVPAVAAQQPLGSGSSSIEGIVVKQGSNQPLAGVELELSRAEETSAPELKYFRTGSDGKFLFKDLKEGKYRLAGALVGGAYYPAEFGQRHPTQRGLNFPLASGQAMKDVKLEMTPTGAIAGRVVDENGQPLGHEEGKTTSLDANVIQK
jgi:5-hydroxyisourate hydrolase-like protein (transthyretin family)